MGACKIYRSKPPMGTCKRKAASILRCGPSSIENQKAKRLGLGFRAQEIMKRFTDEFVPNPASFSQAELRKGKVGCSFLPQAM